MTHTQHYVSDQCLHHLAASYQQRTNSFKNYQPAAAVLSHVNINCIQKYKNLEAQNNRKI